MLMNQYSGLQSGTTVQRVMWAGAVTALLILVVTNPYDKSPDQLLLACTIIVATMLPLSAWLGERGERSIPLLAMHGIFYVACYGVAGFVTPERFIGGIQVLESDYTPALAAALLSWMMVCAGYYSASRRRREKSPQALQIHSLRIDIFAVRVLYPASALAITVIERLGISALTQIAIAVHTFSFIWILHAAWSGKLPETYRLIVLMLYVPAELVIFGGLSEGKLAGLLIYGQTIGITYALTRGRVPAIAAVLVAVMFSLLQPVKSEFRELTRNTGEAQIGRIEGITLFANLTWRYYNDETFNQDAKVTFDDWYSRINHLHTAAAVIAETPATQPYQYGNTLLPLITKWIPRFLWPDKPREDLGNYWAKDYGYLGEEDFITSYNLPWLAEMYMNFGWLGVVVLSFAVGLLMGGWRAWLITRSMTSVQYGYALMLASSFFFPESNLSLQLGDLIIKGVSVWLLLRILPVTRTPLSRLGAQS